MPRVRALAIAVVLPTMLTGAQSVRIDGGNVYYNCDTLRLQLTRGARDSEAALSPDGLMVAFIRRTPGREVRSGLGTAEATELWVVQVSGRGVRRIVVGHPATDMADVLAGMHAPQFSPDGRVVYVLSKAWVTSEAIHAIDLRTGSEHFVAPGNRLEVVPRGEYAGALLVSQHRYWLAGGSFDWLYLLRSNGHEVGPVSDDEGSGSDERVAEWRKTFIPLPPLRHRPSRCS